MTHRLLGLRFIVAACLLLLQTGRLQALDRGLVAVIVVVAGLLLVSSFFRARPWFAALLWAGFVAAAALPDCRGTLLLALVCCSAARLSGRHARALCLLASFLFLAQTALLPPALVNAGDAAFLASGASLAPGVSGLWLAGLASMSALVDRGRSRIRTWCAILVPLVVAGACGATAEIVVRTSHTIAAVSWIIAGVHVVLLCTWAFVLSLGDEPTPVPARRDWQTHLVRWGVVAGVFAALAPFPGPAIRSIAFFNQGGLDWEVPTDGKYGYFEGGMFGLLPIELERSGYSVSAIESDEPLDSALRGRDVLFVINCSEDWSDADLKAIGSWVHDGGHLIVLGDHTDVFGLAKSTNRLLERWGISFEFDSAYHARSSWPGCLAMMAPSWVWTSPDFLLSHAIGASLRLRSDARAVVDGRWGFSDVGVRENVMGSYLGNYHWDRGERFGDVTLVARAGDGAGSVTVYGDTSAFQNGALAGTYHTHILPLLHWLASKPAAWREGLASVWLMGLVLLAWVGRRAAGLLVPCLAASAASSLLWLPVTAPPSSAGATVIVDQTLAPDVGHYAIRWNGTGELVSGLQRAGLHVRYDRIVNAPAGASVAIVAPTVSMDVRMADAVLARTAAGASLIITAGLPHARNLAALLDRVGVSLDNQPLGRVPHPSQTSPFAVEPRFQDAWPIRFAEPSPKAVHWEPVCKSGDAVLVARTRFGHGAIVLIGDSRFWSESNARMGWLTWPGNLRLQDALWSSLFPGVVAPRPRFPSHEKPR